MKGSNFTARDMVKCLNFSMYFISEVISSHNRRTKPIKTFTKCFTDNNVTVWFLATTRNRCK